MIKDEILDRVSMATCDHTDFDGIYKAMDEYAKQQAIAFDVWKRQNGYLIDPEGMVYLKLIIEGNNARNEPVSSDTVYNQFIESQSKRSL
jgi:hypothetical protein